MRSILTGLALILGGAAWAEDEPKQALEAFADGLSSYQAEFQQQVLDFGGRELESSSGTMALMSPNRFRWHYQTPYEQLIVADGEQVWIHDVDLEQITVKSQGPAAAGSPLYVLTDPSSMAERFELEARGEFHGLTLIGLLPRTEEGEFEWVELGFREQLLETITIQDRFGQQTRIRFQRPRRNPQIDPSEFRFDPPPGVDVIGEVDLEFGLE